MRPTKLFKAFFQSEKAGGLTLMFAAVISLFLANSVFQHDYLAIWHYEMAGKPFEYWINDGLMAIFFLLIGLELEREVYIGELSNIKKASLPIMGALGGMLVPAALYILINFGTPMQAGAGIPMATDIAFAIGILSLLGSRVPVSFKIFLTALAVIDDLGAILVIAIFYTDSIAFSNLGIALGIFVLMLVMNRLKIRNVIPYLIFGVAMWYFMLHSGVHATITGVLTAFAIPFGNGDEKSTSYILQHFLHYPVAFLIVPLFALANTGIIISEGWANALLEPIGIGIIIGLFVGKPLGIWLFCYLGKLFKLCELPRGMSFYDLLGIGFLGGIGFTMSIFITLLAFDDASFVLQSKMAILVASGLSGLIGFIFLKYLLSKRKYSADDYEDDDQ